MEKGLHRAVPKPKVTSFCAFFKDPSNEAHPAATALQMAFFSTQFTYKKLRNEAILEASHLGGGVRLVPVSI